jgi:hypothetical protein
MPPRLIGATTTEKCLRIRAELGRATYPTGIKVNDKEMAKLSVESSDFHDEWNCLIKPKVN